MGGHGNPLAVMLLGLGTGGWDLIVRSGGAPL